MTVPARLNRVLSRLPTNHFIKKKVKRIDKIEF